MNDDINSGTSAHAEITQLLMNGLREGATVADMRGVTPDMLEGVYALAHRFYQSGQLEEAETFFRFLCLYDFYNAEYALGLGAVMQLKRDYEAAIGMYAVAQTLALDDDRPMFHVGQCRLAQGKPRQAIECFEAVARRAQGSELGARASAYLDALKQDAASS